MNEYEPWDYLEVEPALDAPVSDNPSGLYCPPCRMSGLIHCAWPEYCGGMKRMKPKDATILTCITCLKVTTPLEARLRRFNEGRCAYCGGELIERPEPSEEEEEEEEEGTSR
jgi:hypothetical protein